MIDLEYAAETLSWLLVWLAGGMTVRAWLAGRPGQGSGRRSHGGVRR